MLFSAEITKHKECLPKNNINAEEAKS
jgi:hypothetical protein